AGHSLLRHAAHRRLLPGCGDRRVTTGLTGNIPHRSCNASQNQPMHSADAVGGGVEAKRKSAFPDVVVVRRTLGTFTGRVPVPSSPAIWRSARTAPLQCARLMPPATNLVVRVRLPDMKTASRASPEHGYQALNRGE